jgi:nitrite reductase/ring-hydroxylating ferredoxin subunit
MSASGAGLALVSDVPDGGAIVIATGPDKSILLARRGAEVFAYENRCAHADYPLERADGGVTVQEGRYLVCAVHGASYALDTGACAGGPCNGRGLKRVAIVIAEGVVRAA